VPGPVAPPATWSTWTQGRASPTKTGQATSADVLGIQIQSQGTEMDQPFDFWIDHVYLIR